MKDEMYKIDDYEVAAYLAYKGMTLVGTSPTSDPRRRDFVFIDSPDRSSYLEDWAVGAGDVRIIQKFARKMHLVSKSLRDEGMQLENL